MARTQTTTPTPACNAVDIPDIGDRRAFDKQSPRFSTSHQEITDAEQWNLLWMRYCRYEQYLHDRATQRSSPSPTPLENPMKAIVYRKYGSPDVLQLEEVDKPSPEDDEVLIELHASSINDWDWGMLRGKPFANRMMAGLIRPSKSRFSGAILQGGLRRLAAR